MRFLVLSQARSGSHMLRAAFQDSPQVDNWYDYRGEDALAPMILPNRLEMFFSKVDPDKVTGVMHHFGEYCEATGVWKPHWVKLRGLFDHVIILRRANHLRRYCSKQLAKRYLKPDMYAAWASEAPRVKHPPPLRVDPSQFSEWVQRCGRVESSILDRMQPLTASVWYEDLVRDWETLMPRLFSYLGLLSEIPKLRTFKQETRPIREVVENSEEVARILQETFARSQRSF